MKGYSKGRQLFLVAGTFLGWLAVTLQFYLILVNRTASVPETILRYFSFFTVLTNILLTLCFSCLLLNPDSAWGGFFSKPSVLTAVTVYMCVVGIVYNVVLRFLWSPKGLQWITDELLHVVNPLLFLSFWIVYVSKAGLKWKHTFYWLPYPVIYIVFILFRGAFSGFYPYPFSDAGHLGYAHVLRNCTKMLLIFFFISLLFVFIGKSLEKSRKRVAPAGE